MKVLTKYHAPLDITQSGPNDYDLTTGVIKNSGWEKYNGQLFVSETFFDVGGLAMEEKTIFPQGIVVQQGSPGLMLGSAAGDSYLVWDVLTSIPIDTALPSLDLIRWIDYGPGFPGGKLNFEHVLFSRYQRWTTDLDTNNQFPIKIEEWQAGSMSPTASDRIYSYRVVLVGLGASATRILAPSVRHVMQVDTKEEQLYEYLMRLKRSYDLQQVPDVD